MLNLCEFLVLRCVVLVLKLLNERQVCYTGEHIPVVAFSVVALLLAFLFIFFGVFSMRDVMKDRAAMEEHYEDLLNASELKERAKLQDQQQQQQAQQQQQQQLQRQQQAGEGFVSLARLPSASDPQTDPTENVTAAAATTTTATTTATTTTNSSSLRNVPLYSVSSIRLEAGDSSAALLTTAQIELPERSQSRASHQSNYSGVSAASAVSDNSQMDGASLVRRRDRRRRSRSPLAPIQIPSKRNIGGGGGSGGAAMNSKSGSGVMSPTSATTGAAGSQQQQQLERAPTMKYVRDRETRTQRYARYIRQAWGRKLIEEQRHHLHPFAFLSTAVRCFLSLFLFSSFVCFFSCCG